MNPLIKIQDLKKYYFSEAKVLKAVDGVSLQIFQGETLGLVGESGCGKSTIARCLLRLIEPTAGEIAFKGVSILDLKGKKLKMVRKQAGMIFQDPYVSLNPRMTIADIIGEPLDIHRIAKGREKKQRIMKLLDLVGLPKESITRFPHEFSGGQKQRIGIARALAMEPAFIVCDEPVSALDVSVQAQIINLLKQLQIELGLTYLLIAHDLRIVKYLSNRVAVMYLGHLVEISSAEELYLSPLHPYTQALLSSIPILDPQKERQRKKIILRGEAALGFTRGCPFASRCPYATLACQHIRPPLREISPNHFVACHLVKEQPVVKEVLQEKVLQNT